MTIISVVLSLVVCVLGCAIVLVPVIQQHRSGSLSLKNDWYLYLAAAAVVLVTFAALYVSISEAWQHLFGE